MVTPARTSRLCFREMGDADLDAMAELLGDPVVMAYYPAPKTRQQALDWITWNKNNYAEHGYGLWIIETADGDFVGDCGLTWQDAAGRRSLEVGYHVRPAMQGRGLATEAVVACKDYARSVVGVDHLIAIIDPDNRPSQRVAEKIGLRLENSDVRDGRRRLIFGADLQHRG